MAEAGEPLLGAGGVELFRIRARGQSWDRQKGRRTVRPQRRSAALRFRRDLDRVPRRWSNYTANISLFQSIQAKKASSSRRS
jgi:hypothetical protein